VVVRSPGFVCLGGGICSHRYSLFIDFAGIQTGRARWLARPHAVAFYREAASFFLITPHPDMKVYKAGSPR
jgi:hypothetical protein